MSITNLLFGLIGITISMLLLFIKQLSQQRRQQKEITALLQQNREQLTQTIHEQQMSSLQKLQESMMLQMQDSRQQIATSLSQHADLLSMHVKTLSEQTDQRLKDISGQVEKRLHDGFEKTTTTFSDVVKRLALIDQAQQKITELSSNVVSLQEILSDRKTRGAFGEVQLSALLRNVLPAQAYSLQHNLSNGKRPDCMLFLPPPTGDIAIDAKFPLETYHLLMDASLSAADRKKAEAQFRIDIKHHINQISSKYIIHGETSDGAIMFIPAESVFAEIHANFADIVELSHRSRVWLASPTTMMAILNTARATLKDAATRQQVHVIQEHLVNLGKDFKRFEKRMDNLTRHISQAHQDIADVNTSAKKITSRFARIEKVEIEQSQQTADALTD